MRVLVTGATGFVGKFLCEALRRRGDEVIRVVRRQPSGSDLLVSDIGPATDWRPAVDLKPDAVVHLAARVPGRNESLNVSLSEFRKVNVEGTRNLARQLAAGGINRLVYLSSIKVCGESSEPGMALKEDAPASPCNPYAISKCEAEQALLEMARDGAMEVVIIRPPLVYGPGVGGNFATMVRLASSGFPLPLGGVQNNRRSLLGLENLADLIIICLRHEAAVNQIFHASDGQDLSTADLLRSIGDAVGRPVRLLPVPVSLLRVAARLIGAPDVHQRLCGSLQVDSEKARQLLGWAPQRFDEYLKAYLGGPSC